MGQGLPTQNPLFLVPFGYGLGTILVQLRERFGTQSYHPWEHRYHEAISEGRIPAHLPFEEFRLKYDDYGHTRYPLDPKQE